MKKLLFLLLSLLFSTSLNATTHGQYQAVKCPKCSKIVMKHSEMTSFNNFGAVYWSDTKRTDIYFPPKIVKCPKCEEYFYTNKNYTKASKSKIKKLKDSSKFALSFDDYIKAFDGIENKRSAYMYIITSYNDLYRNGRIEEAEVKERKNAFKEKATEFISTLDDADANDRILIAELYREMGEFDKCIKMLEQREFEAGFSSIKTQIINQAKAKNAHVFKLE